MSDAVTGPGWTSAVHEPDLSDSKQRRPEHLAPRLRRPRWPDVNDSCEHHTRLIEVCQEQTGFGRSAMSDVDRIVGAHVRVAAIEVHE